jgi:hypothetical protein
MLCYGVNFELEDCRRRDFIAGLGGAVAWPLVARAQQGAVPVIGFVGTGSAEAVADFTSSFRKGLSEIGYVEGQSVSIEYGWANDQPQRLKGLVADMLRRKIAVLAASAGAALIAKEVTSTIPIIFVAGGDPVRYAGAPPMKCFCDLVRRQLRLAPAPLPIRHGALAAVIGAGLDELPFELGQAAQDCHHEPPMRRGGVRPRVCEGFERGARIPDGVQDVEQVARAARQAIQAGYHDVITPSERLEHLRKLRPVRPGPADLLGVDVLHPAGLQRGLLRIKGLAVR